MSTFHSENIIEFLEPVNLFEIADDTAFRPTQIGKNMLVYEEVFPDIEHADLIIVGIGETRGSGLQAVNNRAANNVRTEFYRLFLWHKNIVVADIGNIAAGKSLADSYAALKLILSELSSLRAKVLVIGGSHDLTIAQCDAFASAEQTYNLTCIDALIDMNADGIEPSGKFLLELFTKAPNFLNHYNHIGFQSYFVHPQMLETIDKLRFDCFRVGKVKEDLQEMEPIIRHTDIISFDISAIQNSHAPANILTPNGFNGEEACTLMQYAGMSESARTIGIYGYLAHLDKNNMTAKQISHMIWYLMDGIYKGKQESAFDNRNNFNEFHLAFAEMETTFLQSKKTNRWWMQLPGGNYAPCSYKDYLSATQNEIPERWLRAVERG